MQLFSPFSDQSEHTFQTSSSWAKRPDHRSDIVRRGLVVNFTQRIVQNWNLMRRFLVTNATIQLPEVITSSFTLKVYMMELFKVRIFPIIYFIQKKEGIDRTHPS